MAVTFDPSLDWQTWDGLQPVRVELARRAVAAPGAPARPNPNQVLEVPSAKKRALSKRDLAASGGVYTGLDRRWLIPASLLPAGTTLKPADVVEDSGGTRWTCLEAALNTFESWWALTCRDLVLVLELQDLIQIERAALSYDAAGAAVKAFPSDAANPGGVVLYDRLPARVQPTADEVEDQRGIRGFQSKFSVTVGREVDVTSEDRLRVVQSAALPAGALLDVVSYQRALQIDQLPEISAVRKP